MASDRFALKSPSNQKPLIYPYKWKRMPNP